jgi:hypothetical protein
MKGRYDECGMENVEVMSITKNNKVKKTLYVINVELLTELMHIKNSYLFSNILTK